MAYQAHEARQPDPVEQQPDSEPPAQVLGTTTIQEPAVITDDLYWQLASSTPELLHQSTVQGAPRVFLRAPDVVRADFRLDDGPVQTDTTAPFELSDGAPVQLGGGQHSVTATVTYADGRSQLHQAFFTATS